MQGELLSYRKKSIFYVTIAKGGLKSVRYRNFYRFDLRLLHISLINGSTVIYNKRLKFF